MSEPSVSQPMPKREQFMPDLRRPVGINRSAAKVSKEHADY